MHWGRREEVSGSRDDRMYCLDCQDCVVGTKTVGGEFWV